MVALRVGGLADAAREFVLLGAMGLAQTDGPVGRRWLKAGRSSTRTPYLLFGPMAIGLVVYGLLTNPAPWFVHLALFVAGVFVWTLLEYVLHRFSFHGSAIASNALWMRPLKLHRQLDLAGHAKHHWQPLSRDFLIVPPVTSLGVFAVFLILPGVVVSDFSMAAFFLAGVLVGYLCYESVHFFTHHGHVRTRLGRFLRQHHLSHHYEDDTRRFGVTTPLWDVIFRTYFPEHV